ncbi:hypothetical protein [Microscilla marina]|uniref:Lipoprotein n=1 Tax=Microscilla marina ATCC 23134 TaxID=313606 RepID=A1ZQV2_MICM2|nr:hypothetical protein [Microscilla marina]EAY27257.1 hypothetical protein M23134_06567 [Microscilla marina ATCC 23134]
MKHFINILGLSLWLWVGQLAQAQTATQQLKQSQKKWQKMAAKVGFNYSFHLLESARGRNFRTIVTVKQGKVAGAVQRVSISPGTPPLYTPLSQQALKRLPTLGQVYDQAIGGIVKKAGKNLQLYFDKRDLLVQAGYEEVGCKGDCYKGYKIADIRLTLGAIEQLIVSWTAWVDFKTQCNNRYSFIIQTKQPTDQLEVEKNILVDKGKIIKLVETRVKQGRASRRLYTKAERYKAAQMDKIYENAFVQLSSPPQSNQQHWVKFANNGLLSMSGFLLKNCPSDCFRGFSIVRLRKR